MILCCRGSSSAKNLKKNWSLLFESYLQEDMSSAVMSKIITSQFEISLLWSACFGSVLAMIITTILFCQLLISSAKTFRSKKHHQSELSNKSKVPYILVMIYLISSFLLCALFALLTTNITTFNIQFTYSRCSSSILLTSIFHGAKFITLSLIFLHRIYIIFKNSPFEYKPWIYHSFLILIILTPLILNIPVYFSSKSFSFTVQYDSSSNLALCTPDSLERAPIARVIGGIIGIILQLLVSVGLLLLFIRGLWLLNKQMIKYYLNNSQFNIAQLQPNTNKDETKISTTSQETCSVVTTRDVLDKWRKQKSIIKKQSEQEVQNIVMLHNLIKKQTILVCVASVSTIIIWVRFAVNFFVGILMCWDEIVNVICVWLMLDTSKKYWNICKKHGICMCCYWKTNRLGL